ncbi:MAG TPA: hypothetical protein VIY72_08285, partial [Acidimicrobiales bacterium]
HPGTLAPVELPRERRARREAALVAAGAGPALAMELTTAASRSLRHQLARCLVRPWWPATLAVVALVPSRKVRAVLAIAVSGAVTSAAVRDWLAERPPVGPTTFVVGRLADDVAYGAGVWLGCLRERTAEPLLPLVGRGTTRAG